MTTDWSRFYDGLERVASEEVAAFERTDGEGPAVYELVVWRRAEWR